MKTFITLLKNELKMSIRGMDMLIFAVIMPLVVLTVSNFGLSCKEYFKKVSGNTDKTKYDIVGGSCYVCNLFGMFIN